MSTICRSYALSKAHPALLVATPHPNKTELTLCSTHSTQGYIFVQTKQNLSVHTAGTGSKKPSIVIHGMHLSGPGRGSKPSHGDDATAVMPAARAQRQVSSICCSAQPRNPSCISPTCGTRTFESHSCPDSRVKRQNCPKRQSWAPGAAPQAPVLIRASACCSASSRRSIAAMAPALAAGAAGSGCARSRMATCRRMLCQLHAQRKAPVLSI